MDTPKASVGATKTRVLREGARLLQRHGFGGFSFGDIARRLGLKAPSLYDHYASKEALGLALLEDYRGRLEAWMAKSDAHAPARRLELYFDLFGAFAKDRDLCPVSALCAEHLALPASLRAKTLELLRIQEAWVARALRDGVAVGAFSVRDPATRARELVAQALGGQAVARLQSDPHVLRRLGRNAIAALRRPVRRRASPKESS